MERKVKEMVDYVWVCNVNDKRNSYKEFDSVEEARAYFRKQTGKGFRVAEVEYQFSDGGKHVAAFVVLRKDGHFRKHSPGYQCVSPLSASGRLVHLVYLKPNGERRSAWRSCSA